MKMKKSLLATVLALCMMLTGLVTNVPLAELHVHAEAGTEATGSGAGGTDGGSDEEAVYYYKSALASNYGFIIVWQEYSLGEYEQPIFEQSGAAMTNRFAGMQVNTEGGAIYGFDDSIIWKATVDDVDQTVSFTNNGQKLGLDADGNLTLGGVNDLWKWEETSVDGVFALINVGLENYRLQYDASTGWYATTSTEDASPSKILFYQCSVEEHVCTPDSVGTITTEPTCTENGVRTFYCTECGSVANTEPIQALGHSYSASSDACSQCGTECIKGQRIRAFVAGERIFIYNNAANKTLTDSKSGYWYLVGSSFIDGDEYLRVYPETTIWTVAVVDAEAGTYRFKNGDGEYLSGKDTGDMIGFANVTEATDYSVWKLVDGQYLTNAKSGYSITYSNGRWTTAGTGSALQFFQTDLSTYCEHQWNSTKTTAATCTTDGVMTYTCTEEDCGASYTQSIPATGHSAQYDTDACTHKGTCSVCNTPINEPHTLGSDGKCTVCGAAFAASVTTAAGDLTGYDSAVDALNAVKSTTGSMVTLYAEADLSSMSALPVGIYTLDLNGQWMYGGSSGISTQNGVTLTITDSSDSKAGKISQLFISGGTVTLCGGSYTKITGSIANRIGTGYAVKLDGAQVARDDLTDSSFNDVTIVPCTSHGWDSTTGKCKYCNTLCEHEWHGLGGMCDICHYYCTHEYDSRGQCTICKFRAHGENKHTWSDGECTVCHYQCPHENVGDSGICTFCTMQMPLEMLIGGTHYGWYTTVSDMSDALSAVTGTDAITFKLYADQNTTFKFSRSTVQRTVDLNGYTLGALQVTGGNVTVTAGSITTVTYESGTLTLREGVTVGTLTSSADGTTLSTFLPAKTAYATADDNGGYTTIVSGNVTSLSGVQVVAHEHTYDDTTYTCACGAFCEHNYENGICSVCGGYQEPTLNNGYYEIANAGNLYWFAEQVNGGNTSINGKLTDDITINPGTFDKDGKYTAANGEIAREWTPIGTSTDPFTGSFGGYGYKISGLYFNDSTADYVGLFGCVGDGANIKSITLEQSYICGKDKVGGIIGGTTDGEGGNAIDVTIIENNVKDSVTVSGANYVGGIIGYSYAKTIDSCSAYGKISGSATHVGGIVGNNYNGTIKDCIVKDATVSGTNYVGGIVGSSSGNIESGYVYQVTISGEMYVGGVTGSNAAIITDCKVAEGSVTGTMFVGGVTGKNSGTIKRTHSGSYVTSTDETVAVAGGISGDNSGTVEDCFSQCVLTAKGKGVGGIIGGNSGTIKNCLSICSSISGSGYIGAVAGMTNGGTITNCYYYTSASYIGIGDSESDTAGSTDKKTELQIGSGEVVWLLNGGVTDGTQAWYQQIEEGTENYYYPSLESADEYTVYYGYNSCASSAKAFYTNDSSINAEKPSHYGVITSNGDNTHTTVCSECGDVVGEANVACTFDSDYFCTVCYGEHVHTKGDDGFCTACGRSATKPAQDENGVYLIYTTPELYWFAEQVNRKYGADTNASAKLMANVNINSDVVVWNATKGAYELASDTSKFRDWTPIGMGYSYVTGYYGTFDGNGYMISGIYCNHPGYTYVGLFAKYYAVDLTRLTIRDSYFAGGSYVGAIVGESEGYIKQCAVGADVIVVTASSGYVGGIVGSAYGEITDSYSKAAVTGGVWGGLVGQNCATVKNSFTTAMQPVGVNRPSYGGSLTNVFYGEDTRDYTTPDEGGYTTAKPTFEGATEVIDSTDFTSGKLAWLLQAGVTGELTGYDDEGNPIYGTPSEIWGQTLGTDAYPSFTGKKVYKNSNTGCSLVTEQYSNTDGDFGDPHIYDVDGFCACGAYQPAKWNAGAGYYEISNAGQLYWFAGLVNGGQASINGKLTVDITVNPGTFDKDGNYTAVGGETLRSWTPIGDSTSRYYKGTFDGNSKTISGLYYNGSETWLGLFGYVNGGTVQNITLINSYLSTTGSHVGGIVGIFTGNVIGCATEESVTVRGDFYAGGIAGQVGTKGRVEKCNNAATVYGEKYGGGIAGSNSGTINACYNTGAVSNGSSASDYGAGGIAGSNYYYGGTVENCYNIGTVSGASENASNFGAIVGSNSYTVDVGTVTNCYYLTGSCAKGIGVGSGEATVKTTDEFVSGEVTYLLNGDQSTIVWKQTLDGKSYPGFTGSTVSRSGDTYYNDAAVAGYTLYLEGKIGVNFYTLLSESFLESANAKLVFTLPNGTQEIQAPKDARKVVRDDKTYYVFTCYVAAHEMTSEIKLECYMDNVLVTTDTTTIKDYAMYIINNSGNYVDADVTFAKALLNYGAASQAYFGVLTDDLANKELLADDRQIAQPTLDAYKLTETYSGELGSFTGTSLYLASATSLRAYFEPADGVDIGDITFTVTVGNTIKDVNATKTENGYMLAYDDLMAYELGDKVTFTAKRSSDGTEQTFTCSAMTYAYNVISRQTDTTLYTEELKTLVSALYHYMNASKAYGETNNAE